MKPRFPLAYIDERPVRIRRGSALPPRPWRASTLPRSFGYAFQGLLAAWRTEPNLRLHAYIGTFAVGLGMWLHLTMLEWLWITFAIGLVIFAELMNTAIEQTVDLVVGLNPDPLARQVKDIAAGCVLVAAIIATLVGVLTFGPYLLGT